MALKRAYECDGCGHEAQGYTKDELQKQGWTWNQIGKSSVAAVDEFFILCDSCNGVAETRRQDRRQREQRARVPRVTCSHCHAETIVLSAENVVVGTEFRLALPTSLCRDCDKYPAMLRPLDYEPSDWAMPDFFFPGEAAA